MHIYCIKCNETLLRIPINLEMFSISAAPLATSTPLPFPFLKNPNSMTPLPLGGGTGKTAVQEVGDDVILNCSADREIHLCRWKTPYLNTYIVGEGIYVERGRISWKGTNPTRDCTIQVTFYHFLTLFQ